MMVARSGMTWVKTLDDINKRKADREEMKWIGLYATFVHI